MITMPYPLLYRIIINDYHTISSTLHNNNNMITLPYPLLYKIIIKMITKPYPLLYRIIMK